MECDALDETVERMSAPLSEVWAKPIASNVLHFVLVWQGGYGYMCILSKKCFVEVNEVSEASSNAKIRT